MSKTGIERIAVIGLDGLSWDFLEVLINYGIFTEVKNILAKSFKSILHAYPPSSFPSWSSILTGVNPGKHGIFSFDYLDKQTLTQRLYTALDLEHPRIHEMLAMNKIPCIILNPVPDYPIVPIGNMKVISHMFFTPKVIYYPESMRKYADALKESPKVVTASKEEFLEILCNSIELYLPIVEELISEDWRVFWLNLSIPDRIHHKVPEVLLKGKIGTRIIKIFTTVNKIVKRLRENADVLIILSDHGFKVYRTLISINDFLTKEGYAKVSTEAGHTLREHSEIFLEERGIRRNIKYVKISPILLTLLKPFKSLIKKAYKLLTGSEIRSLRLPIDPNASVAFLQSHSSFGIYVKDEALIRIIKEKLSRIHGMLWVRERGKVFQGPYVSRAPNLFLYPDFERGFSIADNKVYGRVFLKTKSVGHSPFGVFILYYGDTSLGLKIPSTIKTYHITPIIMHLINAPLSHITDDIPILRTVLKTKEFKYRNYVSKWRTLKKVIHARRKIW